MTNWRSALLLFVIVALSVPIFFDGYRTFVFGTMPMDDYRPFLLRLLGHPEGRSPESPFAYRVLSVAAAIPFYFLPPTHLSLAPPTSVAMLRAAQALVASSWLFTVATAFLLLRWAREEGADVAAQLCAAAAPLVASRFLSLHGVDALAIFWLALVVYTEHHGRRLALAAALAASVLVNEKIGMAAALYFGLLAFSRRRVTFPAAAALGACAFYFVVRLVWRVPGHEEQTEAAALLASLAQGVPLLLSGRGGVLILLPVALLLAIAALAPRGKETAAAATTVVGMAIIGMAANTVFNVGRVAMHCYPLLVAAWLGRRDLIAHPNRI